MKVIVHAKTNAKKTHVEEIETLFGINDTREFKISVPRAPVDGKANSAIVIALAKHLKIAPSHCTIIRGAKSKKKIIKIS